jgi:uncharacterized phage protein (TIGR01671 family)
MRDILFRGKAIDGNWYYGVPLVFTEDYVCMTAPHTYNKSVIPSTVGQFTGRTDKNGKKIFEGDVVKAVIIRDLGGGTENREETGVIGYDKIGMIGLIAKYAGTIPVWSDFFQELTLSGCIDDFWFEVIGNIHDNPELLENP